MKMSKSTEKLDNFKIETNGYIAKVEESLIYLKAIDPAYDNLENTAELYRNKIYQIATSLEEQGIDFWSDDFELREAIITHLKIRLYESSVMSKYVGLKVLTSKLLITNKINKRKSKKLEPLTEELNRINNYIKNYDINRNLLETLIEYFRTISDYIKNPEELSIKYNKMKENIKTVCPMDLSKVEDDYITRIINEKQEKNSKKIIKTRQRTI